MRINWATFWSRGLAGVFVFLSDEDDEILLDEDGEELTEDA